MSLKLTYIHGLKVLDNFKNHDKTYMMM